MASNPEPLPEYDRPPVSEVLLSVAFAPLAQWNAAYGGLYWSRIRKEYPKVEALPPLPNQIEQFGAGFWAIPGVHFEMAIPDITRFLFIADPGNELFQVQRDRFS